MKAVALYRYLPVSDPESFLDVEVPDPAPADRDLLVRVRAVSVNPVDTKVRSPKDTVEKEPRILGWDAAGVVEAVGEKCELFRPGDEVYYAGSIVRPGCNSELHLVDERIAGRKPKTLSFAEAAALPLTSITAWEGMFDRMHISPWPVGSAKSAGPAKSTEPAKSSVQGQPPGSARTILVIGGAGGVGSIATQLAKTVAGLRVIATASREESRKWCMSHGADDVIDHSADIPGQLKALGLEYVDYVFCLNSTDMHFAAMTEVVAPEGMICSIVGAGSPLDVSPLTGKSAGFVWELMFTRPRYQTPDMVEQHRLLDSVSDLIDSGQLRTTLTTRLGPINARNLREAHRLVESGHTIGKVVVEGFA